ncbi:MAG TPA: type II CAAX endopeptidase family protein [Steroidobacteraceae bacterium]
MTEASAGGAASGGRAVWLLTHLRLQRLANLMLLAYNRPLGGRRGRPATPGKKRNRWVIGGVVGFFMLFAYGNLTRQSIINLHRALDPIHGTRFAAPSGALSDALLRALGMEWSLLLLVAILGALATRELSQPDWDLEWLVTLPIKMPLLLFSRVMERTIANPIGLLTLLPAGTLLAWVSGYRWSAVLIGTIAVAPLLLLAAVFRTLVDTGLRMSLAPSQLRNLQAVLSIASILLLYLVISLGIPSPLAFVLNWTRHFPAWACWLPPGVAVQMLNAPNLSTSLELAALLAAEVGVALWLGLVLLTYQLRNGVVAASSRESGRTIARMRVDAPAARTSGMPLGTVVQRRELRLLSRDRSFLVQTLVLPVVIVFSQIIFQGRLHSSSLAGVSNATVASIAFGIAAYTLMMSAFQTLNSEGGALWLLFTIPRSLESILREKARLWSVLALAYPLAVFFFAMIIKQHADLELIGFAAIVLLGVPIYAVIAVALGVFGCDPLAQEVRTKLRPTYVYLYMMLAGLYTYAIFASEWWQKIVLIVLSAALSLALWQKARDELPYLLDPAASPPARVSASDGVIAAMMFFVVQGITLAIFMAASHHLSGQAVITAYTVAGAATFSLIRLVYWRSKTQGIPTIFGNTGMALGEGVAWGLAAGVVASIAGVTYIYSLQRLDLLQDVMRESAKGLSAGVWLPLLAVTAAPIFEDFIFRGLIFGGLRRSLGAWPAIAVSAAVFAIVHPPASMIPVFGLGLCTAFAFERTKMLLSPMIAHAIYNAAVLAYQIRLLS